MKKILGFGNALTDVLAPLQSDDILKDIGLKKGCMTLIDEHELARLKSVLGGMPTHQVTGGSAGNAIRTLSWMGVPTGFIGAVGNDAYGEFFRKSLAERGTETHLLVSPTLPSGVATTFISPDGERTFGTYLGAAAALRADDLTPEMFRGYTYLFIEGYLVQDHNLILRAIELAKTAGVKVCLDMASSNVVEADRDFFTTLVKEHVDIIFANEDEAKAFTGQEPEQAVDTLARLCPTAIVKMGAQGSLVRRGDERVQVEAVHADHVADTTGAGDSYAAGFLYGLTKGYSLETCARIGSLISSQVVQVIGTELPQPTWEKLLSQLATFA